jgi:hypothetical protein
MSAKLGMRIDPTQLNLKLLREMGLNSEKAMDAIKTVSEVAYKENSLKL